MDSALQNCRGYFHIVFRDWVWEFGAAAMENIHPCTVMTFPGTSVQVDQCEMLMLMSAESGTLLLCPGKPREDGC